MHSHVHDSDIGPDREYWGYKGSQLLEKVTVVNEFGLAGLLLGISLGLFPREIAPSSRDSPWKTPSIPPLLLGLTQSNGAR